MVEHLGLFLIVSLMASVFVRMARRIPLRRLQRRSLWLSAHVLGLQRHRASHNPQALCFAGDVDDVSVLLLDGTEDDPASSAIHVKVEAPALAVFHIELVGDEWQSACWRASQICLWPPAEQRRLKSLMRQDCSLFVRDGVLELIDPVRGQSSDDTVDLVDDVVAMVATLSEVFSSPQDACWAVLSLLNSAGDEPHQIRCGLAFLLDHADGDRAIAEGVFAQLLDALSAPGPLEQYGVDVPILSHAFIRGLLDAEQKQALSAAALEHEAPRVQLVGARFAGQEGFDRLHQIASDDEVATEVRIEALRHLMAMYPQREEALRGLFRRALSSESRSLQRVAIEALIRRECQTRGRAIPDTYVFLERLFSALQLATKEQIQALSKEMLTLAERPLDALDARWLSLPALIALLKDRTSSSLLPMARSLERWGLAAAEPLLLSWLSHPSGEVRARAIRALGRCGTTAAIPPLQRIASRTWLGRTNQHQLPQRAHRALEQIEARLLDGDIGHLSLCAPAPHRGSLSHPPVIGALSHLPEPDPRDTREETSGAAHEPAEEDDPGDAQAAHVPEAAKASAAPKKRPRLSRKAYSRLIYASSGRPRLPDDRVY